MWVPSWRWARIVTSPFRRLKVSWVALGKVAAGQGRRSFPSAQHLKGCVQFWVSPVQQRWKKQSQHFLSGAQYPTDNKFKLKHKEIHLNLSCFVLVFLLLFFYLWLTSINTGAGCLDGLPPSPEIFKTQMDTAPNTPCWLTGLDEVWTRWSSEVFASLSDFLLPSQGTYKHRKSPPISVDHQTQQSSVV